MAVRGSYSARVSLGNSPGHPIQSRLADDDLSAGGASHWTGDNLQIQPDSGDVRDRNFGELLLQGMTPSVSIAGPARKDGSAVGHGHSTLPRYTTDLHLSGLSWLAQVVACHFRWGYQAARSNPYNGGPVLMVEAARHPVLQWQSVAFGCLDQGLTDERGVVQGLVDARVSVVSPVGREQSSSAPTRLLAVV